MTWYDRSVFDVSFIESFFCASEKAPSMHKCGSSLKAERCSWSRSPFSFSVEDLEIQVDSIFPGYQSYQNSNYPKIPQLQVESLFSATFGRVSSASVSPCFPVKKGLLQHITGVSINLNEIRVHLCHRGSGETGAVWSNPKSSKCQQKCQ